jgi:hypothetical protein
LKLYIHNPYVSISNTGMTTRTRRKEQTKVSYIEDTESGSGDDSAFGSDLCEESGSELSIVDSDAESVSPDANVEETKVKEVSDQRVAKRTPNRRIRAPRKQTVYDDDLDDFDMTSSARISSSVSSSRKAANKPEKQIEAATPSVSKKVRLR